MAFKLIIEVMDERNFKQLKIWQRSKTLSVKIYKITENFPDSEKFGLVSQMRRASVSVPSNIAEGYMRNSRNDFVRFLCIAQGSLAELETQAYLAMDLSFVTIDDQKKLLAEIDEIARMLLVFTKKVREK